ncbi:Phosphoenolpyruvate carboxylase [Deinococcus proteolyticus MRP]|uniref:Phosphoenolpyruvate carboxylase n=1 Tax=Deinococcus proteolyticus (strain ATCC 35074 / DSM 20540 / JCM 6276 / NBRC 101906 / NCIMB 13154 / VKM Ac-1939 / CCM 2703 / MRP) TaxID=693977 RepID=F0RJT2_DEIPM|nr:MULTISPECIES: phosphoenolpyruvate carboxylase [Deinococcus]ADY25558.1 Phosphoenolpyruvate carboxylase [Deinococcus proteolyticus MRP]MCY1701678.1 phosphoenolpyruvate carboxylase [Deinococcus sp. SL84]
MALNRDVSTLGRLLGQVLREQEGEAFFELVEKTRALVREVRAGGDSAELSGLLRGLSREEASNLARAFSWYFQLVNLAEEYERVRVLRERQGTRPQSLLQAVEELHRQGLSAAEAHELLATLQLELTFTAHPTEMRRRTVRQHLVDVVEQLPRLDEEEAQERVLAHIEALWGTPELRRIKPTVADEVKAGLTYISSIARALPVLERDLDRAFAAVYGERGAAGISTQLPLRFSSWMGGDRDGNPFVTPQATRAALELHRQRARDLLAAALRQAYADVSQEDLQAGEGQPTYRDELLALFQAVQRGEAADLSPRLGRVYRQLLEQGQRRTAEELLLPALTLARVFGQHLVSLDIREHSSQTGRAVAELLQASGVTQDYLALDEDARLALLSAELRSRRPLWPAGEPLTETLETAIGPIREVQAAAREVGPAAFGHYVVSMSESVSDVLEPLLLAREVGFRILPVPLFETLDDLEGAPDIVARLLALPEYRAHLGSDVQEIMLGYSDSNKDAGFLAANWALHEAQRRISAVCREAGVRWRFFHGRGTSIGRGGGPASRAILGQPAGTIDAGLRITEQGEALADKYSHPVLARRNLEQALYGMIVAAARPPQDPPAEWMDALDRAARAAAAAYRAFVQDPAFLPFFEQVTPIHEISRLNIASRPVRRPGNPTLSNLRAIPWVMSWTQTRANLPGWYGLNIGLREIGTEQARQMYAEWPFFRAVLDNAQMSLAKTDPAIFREYAALLAGADTPEAVEGGRALAGIIEEAYRDTVALVGEVVGGELLAREPRLAQSILLRNPYVDPIHRIQIELLRRARAEEGGLDRYEHALMLTLQGISAGVRNTG